MVAPGHGLATAQFTATYTLDPTTCATVVNQVAVLEWVNGATVTRVASQTVKCPVGITPLPSATFTATPPPGSAPGTYVLSAYVPDARGQPTAGTAARTTYTIDPAPAPTPRPSPVPSPSPSVAGPSPSPSDTSSPSAPAVTTPCPQAAALVAGTCPSPSPSATPGTPVRTADTGLLGGLNIPIGLVVVVLLIGLGLVVGGGILLLRSAPRSPGVDIERIAQAYIERDILAGRSGKKGNGSG